MAYKMLCLSVTFRRKQSLWQHVLSLLVLNTYYLHQGEMFLFCWFVCVSVFIRTSLLKIHEIHAILEDAM